MITYIYVDGFNLYYGAVKGTPYKSVKPNRQQIYLRALKTIPGLDIIYGHFLEHEVMMPVAGGPPGQPQYVKVIKTEEKGSDVNLAAHMLADGFKGAYQVAILLTNDSDLVEPVKIVREELKLPVGVLNPRPASPSHELRKHATFVKPIRGGVLAASQFPDILTDSTGIIHKPARW